MKKNTWICLLLAALLFASAGCTAKTPEALPTDAPADATAQPMTTAQPTETPAQLPTMEPAVSPAITNAPERQTAAPSETERQNMLRAYADAAQTLLETHALPDGTDSGEQPGGDASANQFAIVDVDGDGRDELLLVYTTTYTAGQTASIWDYNAATGKLRAELIEYPLLTIYSNGVIQAGWSHNQGLAGSFWPYTFYRYDASSDTYLAAGMVDAWEKAFAASAQGQPFPDAVDASGKGIVYYLMPGGVYETVAPQDTAAYDAWRASFVDGAAEMTVSYAALTAENIVKIEE